MTLRHGDIIAKLTLFEKAALLKGKNVWETWDIAGLPSAFMADGPHGLRKQAGSADILGLNPSLPATCFPTASCLANSWDEELLEEVGAALGEEAAALDVSVVLGPGLNIKRSPLCGRNFEYFSEDPLLAGKMAAGLIRGIQSKGVSACPKHFAANSQELLRMSSDSVVDERTLREIYLTGFEIAVKEGSPKALMSSYNKVNGEYAHENYHLLTEILRGEWGYDGTVVSDWGAVNDVVASAAHGGTLEMPGGGLDSARQLVKAVEAGLLSEDVLNQRVDEVIELVLGTTARAKGQVDFDQHHALARKAAERGAVLLKNDGILPLKPGTKVYLAGPFARNLRFQGAGSSQVNAYRVDSAADMVPDAVGSIEEADVVLLYLGLDDAAESEGLDRSHIDLPPEQLDLLNDIAKAGKPIVAVVTAGSVIDMSWTDKAQAVVHGFLHGQAGAGALIDIIMGRVNPSGKLAETYPVALSDTPTWGNYPSEARTAEYREGLYVGYRYYETANVPVAYPFGFGMSFTTFDYTDLVVDESGAAFTVTNSGAVDGDEISQLYITKTGGVFRPVKELKGFRRVSVEARKSVRVTIPFDDRTFRYFSLETGKWGIEGGEYGILIGASVQDIRLSGTLAVQGTAAEISDRETLSPYVSGDIRQVSDEAFAALLGRELPSREWLDNGSLEPNSALRQAEGSKSGLLRLVSRFVHTRSQRIGKDGKPDLNMLFVYNMPFRAFARNLGAVFTTDMVDGVVTIANGHFFNGMGRVIGGFFRNRQANRRDVKSLRRGVRR
ncbi:MAG: glycoside hydrolase family 3 C-terminal domain-containing protein [Propionibacteriaceae bacterium]|nr:glycoside hydrolase family 3 C-terminal domain-containing protein [Propionibacteriaceae bacterium]